MNFKHHFPMNNLSMILVFFLVLTLMFMAYPNRAITATKCLTALLRNFALNKFFEALIVYFNNRKK